MNLYEFILEFLFKTCEKKRIPKSAIKIQQVSNPKSATQILQSALRSGGSLIIGEFIPGLLLKKFKNTESAQLFKKRLQLDVVG